MNNKIAGILKGYLLTLDWSDKVSGLVQTASVRTQEGVEKSYPISCDITADACKKGAYQDLCPDSKKKSVMYFEDKGCSMVERVGSRLKFQSSLRLVGWLNLKLIQEAGCDSEVTGCGSIGDYVIEVIKVFPTSPISSPDFVSFMVSNIDEAERDVSIFSKYSYSETGVQYLLHPFGFFALDLTMNFTIPCGTPKVLPQPPAIPLNALINDDGTPILNDDGSYILTS